MSSQPSTLRQSIAFGEDFELDLRPRRLRRGNRVLKLERIPLEILLLLLEHPGQIVTREQIVARIWGDGVFLDTDNSIRGAIRKIRHVLRDDPEAPRFIQTVTGRGYRFIAPVAAEPAELTGAGQSASAAEPAAAAPVPAEVGTLPPAPASEASTSRRHTRLWLFVGAAALAIAAVLTAAWHWRKSPPSATQHRTVLAVLPFDNLSGDPTEDFFSDGLTEEMIAHIGKLNPERLTVISRSSIARYKGSRLSAKEIGRELNADYLVQGSVRRSSDRLRITIQLIDARHQTDLWTENYDRDLKDVLAVQDSVAASVADQIHIALTDEQKTRLASSRQVAPEAYVAYLKGRYYWNRRTGDGITRAEQYFQQAIDADPGNAAAWSGLADCNSGLAWHGYKAPSDALPRALFAARKAVELDPQSAEAHASLGLVLSHRWEWAEADVEFRRALQLDPGYANAHHWYADYLSIHGRHDEAISESRRALELDPLNLMISTWLGLRYYLARNYSAAIQQNRDSVELDPSFAAAHLLLGEDYDQAGMHTEAISELKTAATLSGDNPLYAAQVGVALAVAGQDREALQIARQLQANRQKRYVSPYGIARIYAALHQDNATFHWLQAACDDHAVWVGYLGVDPVFDRYRSDPRFQDLLRRVGLT